MTYPLLVTQQPPGFRRARPRHSVEYPTLFLIRAEGRIRQTKRGQQQIGPIVGWASRQQWNRLAPTGVDDEHRIAARYRKIGGPPNFSPKLAQQRSGQL